MSDSVLDRIRTVIGQVADSHAAFGARIGMSRDKLSKSLSGARRFTSLELSLIARECGVTLDWLLTGQAPTALSVAARSPGGVLPAPAEVSELTDRFASAYEVLKLHGDQVSHPKLALPSMKQTPRQQGEQLAEAAARIIAKSANISVDRLDTIHVISTLEAAFGLDIAVQPLPDDLHGLAWHGSGRRLILVATTRNWTRQRFTLAHELAHILFCDAQEPVVDHSITPGRSSDPTEIRANWFAAALLMPADAVRAEVQERPVERETLARMVVHFKVSPSAMATRLDTLRLIDAKRLSDLRTMTSVECHKLAGSFESYVEQVEASSSPRLPVGIVKRLFEAYERGATTLRPLANVLGVPVDDLFDLLTGQPAEGEAPVDPETEPFYQL
jgi:hypothetical protein